MEKRPTILLVCGEPSGDLHAASLVRALKQQRPDAVFFGAGGPKLKAQGCELVFDLTSIAVVGLFEVLKNLSVFRRVFYNILKEADRRRPDLAVLIDYPGFNMALAKELRKRNIPVVYYISPQVWAWGKERLAAIKRDVAKMLVILPFEKDFYAKEGIDVSFVGHPAVGSVKPSLSKNAFFAKVGLDNSGFTVSLLPGSREKEVKSLLPDMLRACELIISYMPPKSVRFLILRSTSVPLPVFEKELSRHPGLPCRIVSGMTYDGIAASDFCLVCSGTATLETAILGTPMAVLYKVHFLTWLYVRLAIRIPFIGLVNIVKGRKIMQELIQFDCTPVRIADSVILTLKTHGELERLRKELQGIRESLGETGASDRAAAEIIRILDSR
ncbi:MAG: lipid-A-disaccharide synthase [Deltaproteobacteria bacterium]